MKKTGFFKKGLAAALAAALLASMLPISAAAREQQQAETPSNAVAAVARGNDAFQKSSHTFQANWIWSPSDDGQGNRWMSFRKDVHLDSVPEKVTARIAADTKYWLYINGELAVFEGQLKRGAALLDKDIYLKGTTGQPDLNHMLTQVATYYDEVDLTPYLKEGDNSIVALVWYFGNEGHSHVGSGKGGFLFESQMGNQLVLSDSSWKVSRHKGYQPSGGIGGYAQEYHINYDARQGFDDFSQPNFDVSSWEDAAVLGKAGDKPWNELWPRTIPEWKVWDLVTCTSQDERVTKLDSTHYKVDLPTNIQFTPYIKVNAPAGRTIKMSCPNSGNTSVTYTTKEGVQEYESPSWINWWFINYEVPEDVEVLEFGYRQTGYNTEFEGYFHSDNEFFNTLWTKARDTAYVNIRDTFMDCPDRERAPWLGDAVNEMMIAYYSMSPTVYDAVRKDISVRVNWQNSDGVIPTSAPSTFRDNEYAELPGQSLAGVMSWFQYYLWSGDKETLENAYPALQRYIELFDLDDQNYTDPFVRGSGTNTVHHNWIDWGPNMDQHLSLNIWAYIGVQTLCDFAEALGDDENLAQYQALRDSMKSRFDATFWNGSEYRSKSYSGPADDRGQALAVYAGLASPDKYPILRDILLNNQYADPYMVKYSIEALYLMGYTAEAEQRMKESYSRDVPLDDPTFSEGWGGGGTKNHGWSGGGLISLSGYAAGVRPTKPGFEQFTVAPQMSSVHHIEAGVPTLKGTIQVVADKSENQFDLSVNVPAGSTALIGVPRLENETTMVVCQNKPVWNNGFVTDAVDGLVFSHTDENFIYFEAQPGDWSLSAQPSITAPKERYALTIPALSGGSVLVDGQPVQTPYSQEFEGGTEVSVEAVADEGFVFDLFGGSVGSREAVQTVTMNSDLLLAPEFVRAWTFEGASLSLSSKTADCKLYVNGRAVMNPYNNLLDRGKEVTVLAEAGEEFRFIGWRSDTGDIVSTDPEYTLTLDQDTSLEAVFVSTLGKNLALGRTCTASSNIANNMFDVSKLTDGVYTVTGQNEGWTSLETSPTQWFYVDLGEVTSFDTVKLYPRHNGTDNGYGIPLDLEILISNDAQNWTSVLELEDIERIVSGAHTFQFGSQQARYIKFNGSRLRQNPMDGNRTRFQASEVEVYDGTAALTAPVIERQPVDCETRPGTTARFRVSALSVVMAAYQWECSTDNGVSWNEIQGANSATYSFEANLKASGNLYRCTITNEYGSVTTDAVSYTAVSDNYALKKPFAYSSNQTVPNYFMPEYINDGVTDTLVLVNEGWTSAENHGGSEWVTIDIGEETEVSRVKLYPRYDGTNDGYGIPIDYSVQVSQNGADWITVLSATDVERPTSGPLCLDFDPVSARFVKFEGTRLRPNPMDGNRVRMQIAEFEIYNTHFAPPVTDKSILQSVLSYAQSEPVQAEAARAIESVQASFQAAVEYAAAVNEDAYAEQGEIDAAWMSLMTEIHKLGLIAGDKANLSILIQTGETIVLDNYVQAGKQAFTDALTAAKAVLADGDAVQSEVNQAADALLEAMLALRIKADKTLLARTIAQANAIDLTGFTPASVNLFERAKAAAEQIVANDALSADDQAVVDRAQRDLADAISGLTLSEQAAVTGDTAAAASASVPKTGDTLPVTAAAALLAAAAFLLRKKK